MTNLVSMTAYILAAMQSWIPVTSRPDQIRYAEYAQDMAEVALDPDEVPLRADDEDKSFTAIVIASVARYESGYAENIDTGHCYAHQCDHGQAYSMWQIHPEVGLRLDNRFWTFTTDPDRITGKTLVKDRKLAVKVALHMMRQSLLRGSLCVYVGEPCVPHRHPGADARMNDARAYHRQHHLLYIEEGASNL